MADGVASHITDRAGCVQLPSFAHEQLQLAENQNSHAVFFIDRLHAERVRLEHGASYHGKPKAGKSREGFLVSVVLISEPWTVTSEA